jgi:nucleoside-diphosphate-sugar epimerase
MQMYYVSKTLADQVAMQFAKENKMEVVNIVPVTVAGPWLTMGVPYSVDVTMSHITSLTNFTSFNKPHQLTFFHHHVLFNRKHNYVVFFF